MKVLVAASAGAMVLSGLAAVPAAAAPQPGSVKTWGDARAVVVARGGVNIRSGTSHVNSAWRGNIGRSVIIDVVCKCPGDDVLGNGIWFKLRDGDFVTARYVKNVDYVDWC